MEKMTEESRELAESNMRFVTFIMKKYITVHDQQDYEDYQQQGMLGLCVASMRFDPNKGFKFSTFATPYILGFIKRYQRDSTLLHEPRDFKDKWISISRYKEEHRHDFDEVQMLRDLKIRKSEYSEMIAAKAIVYIDAAIESDKIKDTSSATFERFLSDEMYQDSLEYRENEELLIMLKEDVLEQFSKRNQDIYDDYFYSKLFGENITQQYLSKKYNVSQAQVSRIVKKVNDKLLRRFRKYLDM